MTRGLAFAIDFATTNPFLLFWVPLGVNLGGEREEQLGVNRWVRMLTFRSSDDTYLNSVNISTYSILVLVHNLFDTIAL